MKPNLHPRYAAVIVRDQSAGGMCLGRQRRPCLLTETELRLRGTSREMVQDGLEPWLGQICRVA